MFMSHYATEVCKCPKFYLLNYALGHKFMILQVQSY